MSDEQKTVKVRIAVAVDPEGLWSAGGYSSDGALDFGTLDYILDAVGDGEARYWVEAELPIPQIPVVAGEAKEVTSDE